MNALSKKIFVVFIFLLFVMASQTQQVSAEKTPNNCLWEICAIDTMKMSRDRARQELNNLQFDETIKNEVKLIKETGATHVTIDTPYDSEFLPYLKRWVSYTREAGLKVWFRGNWSSWEGWFEYPKNMLPAAHIEATHNFIVSNPDLFLDGDIFDACPECENAGHWPQPERNREYLKFLQVMEKSNNAAFEKINKNVHSNIHSIIGGRAREVLDKATVDALGGVVTIDHYFADPGNITEYINYFKDDMDAKVVLSEFGAPIPDMHGAMSEDVQASYVDKVLNNIYKAGGNVLGVNYWVLSNGTTALINTDGSKREVYQVLKKYYTPGIIRGTVRNPLGDGVANITIVTSDGIRAVTDEKGNYLLKIPQRTITLSIDNSRYTQRKVKVKVEKMGEDISQNFVIKPHYPDITYKIKLLLKDFMDKF